jgi:hypothetical protein
MGHVRDAATHPGIGQWAVRHRIYRGWPDWRYAEPVPLRGARAGLAVDPEAGTATEGWLNTPAFHERGWLLTAAKALDEPSAAFPSGIIHTRRLQRCPISPDDRPNGIGLIGRIIRTFHRVILSVSTVE